MSSKQLTLGPRQWTMMLTLSLVFGAAFFFFEIGVQTFEPMTFVWLRVAIGATLLWMFIFASKRKVPKAPKIWAAFGVQGFLNNVVPFGLIAWSQLYIDSSLSSILNATTPVWTVLIVGLVMADERLSTLKLIGVAFGVFGVACMIGLDALGLVGQSHVLPQLAVVCGAISYGFAGLWGRRFQKWSIDPVMVATGQVTMASVLLTPYVLFVDPVWLYVGTASAQAWGAAVGIAVLSTAFAYILFFRILAESGATNLSLVTFLVPISATALGVLILGEQLTASHFIGMAIIGVALVMIDGRLLRRNR